MHKRKNQINNVSSISKQDDIVPFQIFLTSFYNVMSAIYFRVIIMVGFSFTDIRMLR